MRIALDISQILYGTGVSVYTKELIGNLVELYPNDQFVLFGGSLRRKGELEAMAQKIGGDSKIFPYPPMLLDFLWNSLHILPIENLIGQVDIIHTSDWTEPPSKIPKVTTVHDLVPFKFPQTTTSQIRTTHRKKMAWVIRESKKIIAVSHTTKNDLVEILKVPEEKIVVIPEGVEERMTPQPLSIQDIVKRRYKTGEEFIFCLSTLEPRKNQKRLIEAFQIVKKTYPNLKLVIGGKSGWGEGLEPVEGVLITGFLPSADLAALYSACLAYVSPSLYEGFGLTPLQAMACGAAVAVSDTGSLPEVVGEAGVYFDPLSPESIASGIITAIQERGRLSKLGIQRATMFSFKEVAKKTHRVYEAVLASS